MTSTVRKRSGTSWDPPVVLKDTWTGSTVCFWKSTFTLHTVERKGSRPAGQTRRERGDSTAGPAAASAGQEHPVNTHRHGLGLLSSSVCCSLNGHTPLQGSRPLSGAYGLTPGLPCSEVSGLGLQNTAGGQVGQVPRRSGDQDA